MSALVPTSHPALRSVAVEVARPTPRTLAPLAKRLRAVGRASDAVGVAAPQIGISQRVFIVDWEGHRLAVANGVIARAGEAQSTDTEGCLSLPGAWYEVSRADEIALVGYDIDAGRQRQWTLSGYLARIVQHEIDHLDGILIEDRGQAEVPDTALELGR